MAHLLLYHAPFTRSTTTRYILEELGVPYDLKIVNLKNNDHKQADFLTLNPMGKLPIIQHNNTIISENVAIALYLGDLFMEKGFTPALTDPNRGSYIRWMIYLATCLEPAALDQADEITRQYPTMNSYGDYERVIETVDGLLSKDHDFLLGDKPTIVDFIWGNSLNWLTRAKYFPKTQVISDYVQRIMNRPAFQKTIAMEKQLSASLQEG